MHFDGDGGELVTGDVQYTNSGERLYILNL